MSDGKRRRFSRLALGVVAVLVVAWFGVRLHAMKARAQRRAGWLREAEADLKALVRLAPPESKKLDTPPWLGNQVIRFQSGWAVGRVHTMHDDEEGWSVSGLGDLSLLVDDKGRAWYSRRHFCTGRLPAANPGEKEGATNQDAKDIAAYIAAFPSLAGQENIWITDKSVVLHDRLWWYWLSPL
jgi:hypothetical protein